MSISNPFWIWNKLEAVINNLQLDNFQIKLSMVIKVEMISTMEKLIVMKKNKKIIK